MDTKFSCLVKGGISVIFGLLALLLPDLTLTTFLALYWLFVIAGIIILLLLATTARGDESLFWFGLSAVLVIVGALSAFAPAIVSIVFLFIIAGAAFYSAFSDITYALEHPKTKYVMLAGMFLVGILLIGVEIRYFPVTGTEIIRNEFLRILGTSALVFGLFSILIGVYPTPSDAPDYAPEPEKPVFRRDTETCKIVRRGK